MCVYFCAAVYLQSCDEYYRNGVRNSNFRYLQSAPGALRHSAPALVYCDVQQNASKAITVVQHDSTGWQRVRSPLLSNDSLSLGSVFRVHYNHNRALLQSLIQNSASCRQSLLVRFSDTETQNCHQALQLTDSAHFMNVFNAPVSISKDSVSCSANQ